MSASSKGPVTQNRSLLPDDLFFALSPQGQASAVRAVRKRKERAPVVEVTTGTMWDYEYQAKHADDVAKILACNSLAKLKAEVRARRWRMAWLTTTKGCFSYGQHCVDEYPYVPAKG